MNNLLYKDIEPKIEGRKEEGNYIDIPSSINDNIKQPLRSYQKKSSWEFYLFYGNK